LRFSGGYEINPKVKSGRALVRGKDRIKIKILKMAFFVFALKAAFFYSKFTPEPLVIHET
jgi:hypothetical protein